MLLLILYLAICTPCVFLSLEGCKPIQLSHFDHFGLAYYIKPPHIIVPSSVVMVMTDVFWKIVIVWEVIYIIVEIFGKLEHPKNRGVTYWSERNGPLSAQIFDQLQKAAISTAFCN
jgi:hypothetical protein